MYILIIYIVIVNLVTSYRLVIDEYYDNVQKTIQLLIIWLLPLLGAAIIAWFLNENKSELVGMCKKYPKLSTFFGKAFFIRVQKVHGKDNPFSKHLDKNFDNIVDAGGGD
jgi:hypothetical protein